MSKKVTLNIKYREKGQDKEAGVGIDFISNYVSNEYTEITNEITGVKKAWDRMNVILQDRGDLLFRLKEKQIEKDDFKDQDGKLLKESDVLEKTIKEYKDDVFFKRRVELIKQILEDNNCKIEMLYDFKFWDRKVEPAELMLFLTSAIYKDVDKKKKGGAGKK